MLGAQEFTGLVASSSSLRYIQRTGGARWPCWHRRDCWGVDAGTRKAGPSMGQPMSTMANVFSLDGEMIRTVTSKPDRHRFSIACSPGRSTSSRKTRAPASRSPMTGSNPYLPPRVDRGGPSQTTTPYPWRTSMLAMSYQSKSPYDRSGTWTMCGAVLAIRLRRRFVAHHCADCSMAVWSPRPSTTDVRPDPHSNVGRPSAASAIAASKDGSAADGFIQSRRAVSHRPSLTARRNSGAPRTKATSRAATPRPVPMPRSLQVEPRGDGAWSRGPQWKGSARPDRSSVVGRSPDTSGA